MKMHVEASRGHVPSMSLVLASRISDGESREEMCELLLCSKTVCMGISLGPTA